MPSLNRSVESSLENLDGVWRNGSCSSEQKFDQIIGQSPVLQSVLADVEQVAPTDSTVLILGETGTGKELVAQALHKLSSRRDFPFIKVNCAAIPFDLLESDLFGHERGAFTGALSQKIGRFEMADCGTLFLDEIGDLPLALQPKLLRVLQEKEFERLGSGRTLNVDVRVIVATHRNLREMVRRNEFRSDLYYRLNVFPVVLPPLRERRQDIAPLVWHFARIFSRRMAKRIDHIPEETLASFVSYSWPGNVRELQNLVERAVILSSDGVLPNPLHLCAADECPKRTSSNELSRQSEREFVLRALQAAGWVIGGPNGAAGRLGLKRTTLLARMKKLGISRPGTTGICDEAGYDGQKDNADTSMR